MSIICIFGDSIAWGASDSEKGGWVERLKVFMGENYNSDVYNLGISGDKTPNILKRFKLEAKARTKEAEDVVFIFAIGINDSCFVRSKNGLMIQPKKFKANIERIIKQAKAITPKIIFIGLNPVDESKTTPISWDTGKSYKNENIKKHDEIIKLICKEKKVYFVGIFKNWIESNYKELLEDGLHPNVAGHKRIFEAVQSFLIKKKIIKI